MQDQRATPSRPIAPSDGNDAVSKTDGGIAYRVYGAGPALVLLHGWGVDSRAFGPVVPALARRHRVIVPDQRGHGASVAFPEEGDFGLFADDLEALLAALALDRAVLLGWSMGALVAWDFARRYGTGRLAGLITVDMVPRLLNDAGWPHGLRRGEGAEAFAASMAAMEEDWPAYTRVFVPRVFAEEPATDDPRAALLYGAALANDGCVMARVWGAMVREDFRDDLPSIRLPSLHVYGEASRLYGSAAARWVGSRLADGAVTGIRGAGHAPHLEQPEPFLAVVEGFLRRVQGAGDRNDSETAALDAVGDTRSAGDDRHHSYGGSRDA